jgi:hypothetical protein
MGCDIHMYIERRTADGWCLIAPPAPPPIEQRTERRARRDGTPYNYVSPFWGPGFYAAVCYGVDDEEKVDYDAEVNLACVSSACPRCLGTGRDLRWWHDRNYSVFSILSGTVRNDGNIRGIVPEPRGLPDDATPTVRDHHSWDHSEGWLTLDEVLAFDWEATYVDRGVIPLLPGEHADPFVMDNYAEWRDRKPRKAPKSWSGAVGGGGTYTVTMAVADCILAAHADGRRIDRAETAVDRAAARWGFRSQDPRHVVNPDPLLCYVEAEWSQSYRDCAERFLSFVSDYLVPLGDPRDTRLVFGFDS